MNSHTQDRENTCAYLDIAVRPFDGCTRNVRPLKVYYYPVRALSTIKLANFC